MSFEKPSSRQIIVICLLFAAITFGAYICYQTSRNWRKQAEIIVSTMQKMKELVKDNPPSHPDSLEWFNDYVFMNTEVGFSFVGVKQDNSQAVLCDDSCKEWSPSVAKYLASVAKAKKLFNSINGNEYFRKTDHAVYMFIFREPEIADSAPVQDDSNITIKSIIQLFVFVIIILVICYILISKFIGKKSCQKDDNFYGVKDNPSKNEDVNDDENLDSAPTFTCSKEHKAEYERLYDTLCLHGLTKYIAHNNFLLSGKYYKSILPQKYINDAVSDLIKEMFDYLDIIDSNIEIYVSYSNNDRFVKNKDTTGQYCTEDTGTKSITIKVFTDYTYKEVAAIAAYECTHYFAELHKLSVSDTKKNERQTDIYAIMLGFGELLYEGYSPNAKSQYSNKNGVNTETTFQNRIGYISSLECLEIMDFIETEKKEIENKQNKNKKIESKRIIIINKCETIEHMYEVLNILADNEKNKFINIRDTNYLQSVQNLYVAIEQGDIQRILKDIKLSTKNASTIAELSLVEKQLDELGAKITSWSYILQHKSEAI